MIDAAQHVGLVRLVAARIARTLPGRPDPEELWGDGYLGLAAAAGRFSPARGCTFSTYAVPRIEGAMRDGERARRGWRRRTPGKRRIAEAVSVERLRELADRGEMATRTAAPQLPPDPARTDDALLAADRVAALRRALLELPAVERTVLAMYHFDELPLRLIGQVLGFSEARASQIRKHALGRLRHRLTRVM